MLLLISIRTFGVPLNGMGCKHRRCRFPRRLIEHKGMRLSPLLVEQHYMSVLACYGEH